MIHRILKCSKTFSFFLFGARGTGKSTYLQSQFAKNYPKKSILWVDLLEPERERALSLEPSLLVQEIQAWKPPPELIVIDEVQKIPKLLDVVHGLIQAKKFKFALTGSSARKLKRGSSNLLAGRAFVYKLFPMTFLELGDQFDLDVVLQRGSLPEIFNFKDDSDRIRYLNAYVQTYLHEEILEEQIIRKIEPFRHFLNVASQCNGEILNYSRISREAGIESKSCQRYFEVLEDTLLGFYLPAFSASIRKQQSKSPKFYFFDLGVTRALSGSLNSSLVPSTFGFGKSFEHLVILEFFRLNHYSEAQYQMSYFRSKQGLEVDLILERGKEKILIEIKSGKKVTSDDLKPILSVREDIKPQKSFIFSTVSQSRTDQGIKICNWKEGLKEIFNI